MFFFPNVHFAWFSARLIFAADDAAASEYLKDDYMVCVRNSASFDVARWEDLISSAGLKDAWAECLPHFNSMTCSHV